MIAQNENLVSRNNSGTWDGKWMRQYNDKDSYGFPNINTTQMYSGSELLYGTTSNACLTPAGRCTSDDNSTPTPYNNATGCDWGWNQLAPHATIKAYTRGSHFRDQEWVIPTYCPDYSNSSTNTLQSPTKKFPIYWINIRNMLYRIGYYDEPGNIDTFHPCPIVKKSGQVFRVVFRERIARHTAGA
jgi:hypothetical protein